MSLPPPPDSFGSQPPNGGGGPQWGGPPQQGHGGQPPYMGGPPSGQHQGTPPQWRPQQQWAGGPPLPPPNKGGKGKWILIGLALVAVIALSIAGTVIVLRSDSNGGDGPTQSAQGSDSEFASANDTEAVNIITDDETCAAWGRISRELSNIAVSVQWGDRDYAVPAAEWTPQQRTMYESVSKAQLNAATEAAKLARQTSNRVMRQLYEQFQVYAQLFSDRLSNYTAEDDNIAVTTDDIASSISNICSAANYKSAQSVAGQLSSPNAPTNASSDASDDLQRFLTTTNPACSKISAAVSTFSDATVAWRAIDPNIGSEGWTPEQRATYEAAGAAMVANADELEEIGRQSNNSVLEDFTTLAAQYRRAFAKVIPSYTPADNYLAQSASYLVQTVNWACKAAE